jgi:dihydropteroate synthase
MGSHDLWLGARAIALEARAKLVGGTPGSGGRRARVAFEPSVLAPSEMDRLARIAGAILEPAAAPGRLATLDAPIEALAEVGRSDEVAAILHAAWSAATRAAAPLELMGIVNVTPDSFSDGGRFLEPAAAVAQGLALARSGAAILDIGGESTRPGAQPVAELDELARVLPVIAELARTTDARLSIDTTKSGVARAALEAGATLVNDVSAARFDPEMLAVVAEQRASIVLMHMAGTPRDMQTAPSYGDVVREVLAHLRERAHCAASAGIPPERMLIDPGLGFGKRQADNLALLRALPELRSLGLPLLIGPSRKSFLGSITGTRVPEERAVETAASVALSAYLGADILRVHDVASAHRAAAVGRALSESS